MKRRDFVASVVAAGFAAPVIGNEQKGKEKERPKDPGDHGHGHHGHSDRKDRLATHTVSFGQWGPTPDYPPDPAELNTANPQPIDRFAPNDLFPRRLNGHFVIPGKTRIEVGDSVNFTIAGFHLLLIYGPGVQPHEVDRTKLIFSPPDTFPPLINDPNNRLYRGLDPRAIAGLQDRVETVAFNTPGRYLVACGVLPHFFDAATASFVMIGFVDVHD